MGAELMIAVPKGRLLRPAVKFLRSVGLASLPPRENSRSLLLRDERTGNSLLFVKPGDVITYVHRGVADLGVVGKDVLLEENKPVFEAYDLGLARCHLAVAGPADRVRRCGGADGLYSRYRGRVRVATEFPSLTRRHFQKRGIPAEIIPLGGSVELAPRVGLASLIVDVVETGETLKANDLAEVEKIADISARLIVNPVSLKVNPDIRALLAGLYDGEGKSEDG